jgi:hypothetical protein
VFAERGTKITDCKEEEKEEETGSFMALQAMTDYEVRKVYYGYNSANTF